MTKHKLLHWPVFHAGSICIGLLAATGCADAPKEKTTTPTFAQKLGERPNSSTISFDANIGHMSIAGPTPPVSTMSAPTSFAPPSQIGNGQTEALSLEQVTLPAFVDEVYAKALKLTVEIDQAAGQPHGSRDIAHRYSFASAGVIRHGQQGFGRLRACGKLGRSILHVTTDLAMAAQMPDLIRSRALPDIPVALRPIFQVVELPSGRGRRHDADSLKRIRGQGQTLRHAKIQHDHGVRQTGGCPRRDFGGASSGSGAPRRSSEPAFRPGLLDCSKTCHEIGRGLTGRRV